MDMDKILKSAQGYPDRQKYIDENLTPERVYNLIVHPNIRAQIKGNPAQKMITLVFASTQAIERYLKTSDPNFRPEVIAVTMSSIEEAATQNPNSNTIKACRSNPNTFCVCVASWIPVESIMTHTLSCFTCDMLKAYF